MKEFRTRSGGSCRLPHDEEVFERQHDDSVYGRKFWIVNGSEGYHGKSTREIVLGDARSTGRQPHGRPAHHGTVWDKNDVMEKGEECTSLRYSVPPLPTGRLNF